MPAVDRAVLRMATYELLALSDVPTAVVISEAVDLASEYSTDESGRFVNGRSSPPWRRRYAGRGLTHGFRASTTNMRSTNEQFAAESASPLRRSIPQVGKKPRWVKARCANSWRDLRKAIEECARGFDPALLSAGQAAQIVSHAASIEAIASAVKALTAGRAADGFDRRSSEYRSPAEALAKQIGLSGGAAHETLQTGRRLVLQPEVAKAALAVELSAPQVALIADAADLTPSAAPALLEQVKESSLSELRNEVAKIKAAIKDPEARRQAIREKRRLRTWTDVEGIWNLRASGNPEDGARVMTAHPTHSG